MNEVPLANNSITEEAPSTPVMVPHTPEGAPPETDIVMVALPPMPPRREKTITIQSDSALAAHFIQMMASHPEEFEWKEDVIKATVLKRLSITNTKMAGLESFLGNLTYLTHLNLSFNRIVDISALSMCPSLENLDMAHNKIISLDSIREIRTLKTLRCHNNHLESLEPVIGLTSLEDLWVSNNELAWSEFIYLLPLIKLRSLVKFENPADDKKFLDNFVHALCMQLRYIDGVDIRGRYEQESVRGFLRSTDGKIMFSQALSQLPSHTQKILHESEGDKMRLRVEYSLDGECAGVDMYGHDGSTNGQVLPHAKQKAMMAGDKTKAGRILRPFRRGRRDVLHKDRRGDEAEVLEGRDASVMRHSQMGGATKSHLKGVKSSGYGQNTTNITRVPPVTHVRAQKNVNSVDYGSPENSNKRGKHRDLSPILGARKKVPNSKSPQRSHQGSPPHGSPFKSPKVQVPLAHLVRFGPSEQDPVALSINRDGSGIARYPPKGNGVCVSVENAQSDGRHAFLAYYRSGSLALTVDPDGNGSIMTARGKCVCLITTSGGGQAKILSPKTGKVLAQYSKPSGGAIHGQGHHSNAVELGGERGSAEPGSDTVLQTSASAASLGDKEKENLAMGTAVPQSDQKQRRRHAWKFEGLQIEFIPSTWEVKVLVDNEATTAEFSSLSGARLIKLKGAAKDVAHGTSSTRPTVDAENVPVAVYPNQSDSPLRKADSDKSPYLQKGLKEQPHSHIRQEADDVISNLDLLLSDLTGAIADKAERAGGAEPGKPQSRKGQGKQSGKYSHVGAKVSSRRSGKVSNKGNAGGLDLRKEDAGVAEVMVDDEASEGSFYTSAKPGQSNPVVLSPTPGTLSGNASGSLSPRGVDLKQEDASVAEVAVDEEARDGNFYTSAKPGVSSPVVLSPTPPHESQPASAL